MLLVVRHQQPAQPNGEGVLLCIGISDVGLLAIAKDFIMLMFKLLLLVAVEACAASGRLAPTPPMGWCAFLSYFLLVFGAANPDQGQGVTTALMTVDKVSVGISQ